MREPNKLVQGKKDWRRHKSRLSEEVQRRDIGWFQVNGEIAQLARAWDSYPQGRWFESTSRYKLMPVSSSWPRTPDFHSGNHRFESGRGYKNGSLAQLEDAFASKAKFLWARIPQELLKILNFQES